MAFIYGKSGNEKGGSPTFEQMSVERPQNRSFNQEPAPEARAEERQLLCEGERLSAVVKDRERAQVANKLEMSDQFAKEALKRFAEKMESTAEDKTNRIMTFPEVRHGQVKKFVQGQRASEQLEFEAEGLSVAGAKVMKKPRLESGESTLGLHVLGMLSDTSLQVELATNLMTDQQKKNLQDSEDMLTSDPRQKSGLEQYIQPASFQSHSKSDLESAEMVDAEGGADTDNANATAGQGGAGSIQPPADNPQNKDLAADEQVEGKDETGGGNAGGGEDEDEDDDSEDDDLGNIDQTLKDIMIVHAAMLGMPRKASRKVLKNKNVSAVLFYGDAAVEGIVSRFYAFERDVNKVNNIFMVNDLMMETDLSLDAVVGELSATRAPSFFVILGLDRAPQFHDRIMDHMAAFDEDQIPVTVIATATSVDGMAADFRKKFYHMHIMIEAVVQVQQP